MKNSCYFSKAIDGEKCMEVRIVLDNMITGERNAAKRLMKKYKFTLTDIDVACLCLMDLWKIGKTECIQPSVKEMFKSFGFIVKDEGIGWIIKQP